MEQDSNEYWSFLTSWMKEGDPRVWLAQEQHENGEQV